VSSTPWSDLEVSQKALSGSTSACSETISAAPKPRWADLASEEEEEGEGEEEEEEGDEEREEEQAEQKEQEVVCSTGAKPEHDMEAMVTPVNGELPLGRPRFARPSRS